MVGLTFLSSEPQSITFGLVNIFLPSILDLQETLQLLCGGWAQGEIDWPQFRERKMWVREHVTHYWVCPHFSFLYAY